jgi:hypothetical protein
MRVFLLIVLTGAAFAQQNDLRRTIGDSAPARKAPARTPEQARDPGSSSLDALISSTENLNVIRDRNVERLRQCSPDATQRIAEIRDRLGIKAGAAKKDPNTEASLLAVSANWNRMTPDAKAAARPQSDQIDAVLPRSDKNPEADAAALRTELDRLIASCNGGRK